MPTVAEWWVYVTAVALIAATPGPGLLYVLARSVRGGRVEGIRSTLGNALGAGVHVVAAAFGVSALLATSAVAFTALKLIGAGYICWLGLRALVELRAVHPHPTLPGNSGKAGRSAVGQGLLTEVCNPKTAIFFLAFLPQFVHADRGSGTLVFVLLGAVFVVCTLLADVALAVVAGPLATWLAREPKWWRRQQAASGVALLGLGGALAATSN